MNSISLWSGRAKVKSIISISIVILLEISMGNFVFQNTAIASGELNFDSCIDNTIDEPQCKDCCDCLDDPDERQSCRDTCAVIDFSDNNIDFITVNVPSILGPEGDYSTALEAGSETAAKAYCDQSDDLACGDRRYCRDAVNAAFGGSNTDPDPNDQVDTNNETNISISQAISDEAQLKTIAFSGLGFLTGDLCSSTFFPPGKVSDFFGFQYLRDITPNGFGHNTEFAGRISDSVLSILTNDQVQALVSMANTQASLVDAYGYKRFVLIKAFQRLLENELPEGATGLDLSAMTKFTGNLYEIDAQISYNRANVLGGIVAQLTNAQIAEFSALMTAFNTLFEQAGEGGTIASEDWPTASQVDLSGLVVTDGRVLVSTFATQLFSWYLGSIEGDTYFCPERHGTYFGSFYMKDIPPLTATEAVTIDSNLTADMGQAFLDALNDTQEDLVTNLIDIQKTDLNNIVTTRQMISEKLRVFMSGTTVDESEVKALVRQYGEYEGEMMYYYATNFATVGNTLTDAQTDALMGLRVDYYSSFPDYQVNPNAYDCSGAWLYASKIDMPDIINTDFLFGVGEESDTNTGSTSVVQEGAEIALVADGFLFAEGPAADKDGNLYFSDILTNKIYKWTVNGDLSEIRTDSGGANGLFFDSNNNLVVCQGNNQRLVSIDLSGILSVLTDEYDNMPYNEPNDLWIDPKGGIYFSDPVYTASQVQDGEHVYYLTPNRDNLIRVVNDMVRPNGIVGSEDGTTLYVADHGAGNTYQYDINQDGSLSNKQLFTEVGADGVTIDSDGNVYLCAENILVYDPSGNLIETILTPDQPTNACFGGSGGKTLFITTKNAVYSLKMNSTGVSSFGNNDNGTLISPSGEIEDSAPTFTWNEDPASTWYKLWVGNSSQEKLHAQWYKALDICSDGSCKVTLESEFTSDSYEWWVKSWNENSSVWSDGMSFSVQGNGTLPSKIIHTSPSGNFTDSTPTYAWHEDSVSTWYKLWVGNSSGERIFVQWYEASDICSEGDCSVTPESDLSEGEYAWWIKSWNEYGEVWSNGMGFIVTE